MNVGATVAEPASLTSHLVECVTEIARTPLPAAIERQAALCLLDYAAALLAAAHAAEATAAEAALSAFGSGHADIVGRAQQSSVAGAAFFHGFVATIADLDDAHRFASGLHMAATTFPAALALAADRDLAMADLLRAAVAGYEVSSRLARAMDDGFRRRGLHATGIVGQFGTAAAVATLLGLDETRTRHALAIAASGGGGLLAFQAEGATVRHAHSAWASVNGLTAALMAEAGATGPINALDGAKGFLAVYADAIDEAFIRAAPPSVSGRYEIENAYRKLFSACGHALPALSAALSLRDKMAGRLDAIASIEVRGYAASARLVNPAPTSVGEAKFSIPYIVAMALIFGDVGAEQMTLSTLRRRDVCDLAARVSVVEDPALSADFPSKRSAFVAIRMQGGEELSTREDAPKGMPENPASEEDILRKLDSFANEGPQRDRIEDARGHGISALTSQSPRAFANWLAQPNPPIGLSVHEMKADQGRCSRLSFEA